VRLSDFITEQNRLTCVKIRGLPFSTNVKEIREFFADFRIAERDIVIDKSRGQPTGYALVFLENETEAERAKKTLDRQYVGSRCVDVFFPDGQK
jgi:RNA recognition motif-containing protein